jgi:RNA polymerase sigma factor (sigma-70 family)
MHTNMGKQITEDCVLELLKDKKAKKEGVTALIERYQMPLYWHIRKLIVNHDDSKDVLQEVFLRVWRNIDQFKGDSKLFTWLYRIATNESLRFLERKQKRIAPQLSIQEMLELELETSAYLSGEEIQMTLQKAILGLTEKQRLVFNMHYYDELDYTDIATILETTVNNVKVLYHYAKNKIEEQIKNEL